MGSFVGPGTGVGLVRKLVKSDPSLQCSWPYSTRVNPCSGALHVPAQDAGTGSWAQGTPELWTLSQLFSESKIISE